MSDSDVILAGRTQYNEIMFERPHVLAAIDVTARFHLAALWRIPVDSVPYRVMH